MSHFLLRFHLLRVPQLDEISLVGFALGIDAGFADEAFHSEGNGASLVDDLLGRVRTGLFAGNLTPIQTASYEKEIANHLELLMPWMWKPMQLEAWMDGNWVPWQPLANAHGAPAEKRRPFWQAIDRRNAANPTWSATIYGAPGSQHHWLLPNGEKEVVVSSEIPPWPALLATLAQETAPVPTAYFNLYRPFQLPRPATALAGNIVVRLSFGAHEKPLAFDFGVDPVPDTVITIGKRSVDVAASLDSVSWSDVGIDLGSQGWIVPTARQGPSVQVLSQRLQPLLDRPTLLLDWPESRLNVGKVLLEIDAWLGFGARPDANGRYVCLALDGSNLLRTVVANSTQLDHLEKEAIAWQPLGDDYAVGKLLADGGSELPTALQRLSVKLKNDKLIQEIESSIELQTTLRDLYSALLTPAALFRRFTRLWNLPADSEVRSALSDTNLPRRIALDGASRQIEEVLTVSKGEVDKLEHELASTLQPLLGQQTAKAAAKKIVEDVAFVGEADLGDTDGLAIGFGTSVNDSGDAAGVAMLVRRLDPAPMKEWHCPLLGEGVIANPDDPAGWIGTEEVALGVVPLRRMQGMLTADIVYEGETLVEFADAPVGLISGGDTTELRDLYKVRFPDVPSEAMRCPTLAYGGRYQAAAFALANPGVLPPTLRDSKQNWRMKDRLSEDAVPMEFRSNEIRFLRNRPIQAPEFRIKLPGNPDVLPPRQARTGEPAQAGVPYGRDARLLSSELSPQQAPMFLAGQAAPKSQKLKALLLLPGLDVTDATFQIRPPRTDFLTFLRWCEFDAISATDLVEKQDWEEFLANVEALQSWLQTLTDDERQGRMPVDPAVVGITLELLDSTGDPVAWSDGNSQAREVKFPLLKDLLKAPTDERGFLTVNVEIGDTEPASLELKTDAQGGILNLVLPKGSVHYLRFGFTCIDADRFSDSAKPENWPSLVVPIEIGVRELPNGLAKSLHEALAVQVTKDRSVVLDVIPEQAKDVDLQRWFRMLDEVGAGIQFWRWQGRPVPALPGRLTTASELAALRWEANAFLGRADQPARVDPMRMLAGGRTRVMEEKAGGDGRERYLRLTACARHRYAQIYRTMGKPLDISQECIEAMRSAELGGDVFHDRWVRIVRPGHRTEPVPSPRIKAFIPLTSSNAKDGRIESAGVMCVLNESFFEIGGLAEELDVGIERVVLADHAMEERGLDPLLTGDGQMRPGELAALEVSGPLGHGFDADTAAPLFVASSFVIDPAPGSQSFDFMKLAVRRALTPAGMVDIPDDAVVSPASADNVSKRGEFVGQCLPPVLGSSVRLRFNRYLPDGSGGAKSDPAFLTVINGHNGLVFEFTGGSHGVSGSDMPKDVLALRFLIKRIAVVRANGAESGSRWEVVVQTAHQVLSDGVRDSQHGLPPLELNHAWRRAFVGEFIHHQPVKPLGFAIEVSGEKMVIAGGPCLSEYTPATWVQCLPDRRWMLDPPFGDASLNLPATTDAEARGSFQLMHAGSALSLMQPQDSDVMKANSKTIAPAFVDGKRGLARVLLLTRLTRGLDGREFEAYVGVFASTKRGGAKGMAEEPWFSRLDGRTPEVGEGGLRLRIIWLQLLPDLAKLPTKDFWTMCFPITTVGPRPEAQARLVAVSAHADVHSLRTR